MTSVGDVFITICNFPQIQTTRIIGTELRVIEFSLLRPEQHRARALRSVRTRRPAATSGYLTGRQIVVLCSYEQPGFQAL
jgi:hypothetical protein